MNKLFYIDGGAGRVVAAIPALLKYYKRNPNSDWAILVVGWDSLLWGIPELQNRSYNTETKGIFESVIKNASEIVTPEPYRIPDYYNQKISLAQAFDREINNTTDHSDLEPPKLVSTNLEFTHAFSIIEDAKTQQRKEKTIVIQPFGRGISKISNYLVDESHRSLPSDMYLKIVEKLSKKYNLILFSEPDFYLSDDIFTHKPNVDLRLWPAIIQLADYFVGVDSLGQHIARAVGTNGTVIMGSTFSINTSYPEYFNIVERNVDRMYSPIRISGFESHMADRLNSKTMEYTEAEINEICRKIQNELK